MKQVVVILEHDGSGDGAVPIAVIELPDGDPANDLVVQDWLENHDWREAWVNGEHVWMKEIRGLYSTQTRFAAVSDPMFVQEAR